MPELTGPQKAALVDLLQQYFPLKSDFERTVVDLEKKCQGRASTSKGDFSITRWIRGLMASQRLPGLKGTDPEADLRYFQGHNSEVRKDLSTSGTPGSYLVPVIQAAEIVSLLSDYGVLRRAGCRIIPMVGIEKLTMPVAMAYPTMEWLGENSAQSSSDANLGQVSFALKTCRSLTPIPNELLAVSVPAIDAIMAEILAIGSAEAEDKAFFATTQVTNGPSNLYSAISDLTSLLAGGNSANGGPLTYQDLLSTLGASRKAKARGPFAWFTNPHVVYDCIAGLLDKNSRPIFDANQVVQRLFGWPIFDTVWINQDQTNGSGSLQSFMVLANPQYIMIGEPGTVEIAVSTEFYFDRNQIAIRSVKRTDFGWAPAKGITILRGIN
jgi:HK97 family phage major capsid protein